jgi:hypothetical protein
MRAAAAFSMLLLTVVVFVLSAFLSGAALTLLDIAHDARIIARIATEKQQTKSAAKSDNK